MTKIYKLLIDSPSYPVGTIADYDKDTDSYLLYLSQEQKNAGDGYYNTLPIELVENRGTVWELQEEKLDLRSPEAEKMRDESRATRFDCVPASSCRYFSYSIGKNTTYALYYSDATFLFDWYCGFIKCTEEEAKVHGEKYARYFLTE